MLTVREVGVVLPALRIEGEVVAVDLLPFAGEDVLEAALAVSYTHLTLPTICSV